VLLARLPEEKERAEKERPLCVCVCVGGSAGTACRSLSMFLPITLASPSACVKGWRHMVNPTRFFTLGYNKHGPALYAHSGGVIRSTKTAVWTRHILSKSGVLLPLERPHGSIWVSADTEMKCIIEKVRAVCPCA
jgi:hypothetical protein